MKDIRVTSYWRGVDVIEVPDDWDESLPLMEWPDEYLEQVTALGAELTDWEPG